MTRRPITLLAAVGLVAGLIAAVWVLRDDDGTPPSESANTSDAPTTTDSFPRSIAGLADDFDDDDARTMEAALASSDPVVNADALVPELAAAPELPRPLFPEGTTISIDIASFEPLGDDLDLVDSRIIGPREGPWRLFLVRDSSGWLVLTTEPL